jgi:predicted RNA binding protein YcfA (HicA-like mRNA interferase family)
MTRLPSLTSIEVAKVLEKMDFRLVRQRGSHRMYTKGKVAITIPMHAGDLRKGTLHHIIKQTGLSIEEFLQYT